MLASHDLLTDGSRAVLAKAVARPSSPSPQAARDGNAAMAKWVSKPAPPQVRIEDFAFMARDGARLGIRRFLPPTSNGGVPARSLVFLHGGGWVVGTPEVYGPLCAKFALAFQAQVFFVDYRLSPEVKYPVPNQDCEDAYRTLMNQAGTLGIDPAQVFVGGDSAGGHLSVTLCRWLKKSASNKTDKTPKPKAQLLIYPVADRHLASDSVDQFGEGFYLTKAGMEWYWQQYLPSDGAPPATHPDLSPALAFDLEGLPPAVIITAGCDILRDEGSALGRAFESAGVRTIYHSVPGMLHGFFRFDQFCPESQASLEWLCEQAVRL